MPKPIVLFVNCALVFCALAGLSGCDTLPHQQAFYVSPFNGSAQEYHTLPLHTDTATTAVYARAAGHIGSANDLGNDHFSGGNVSLYVAHHGSWWQSYYGVDGTLGCYSLGTWTSRDPQSFNFILYDGRPAPPPATASQLNSYTGGYTYGGFGASVGFNGVIPMGQGEWRVLGVETALHQEIGDYLHLRRRLADSVASYIVRNPFYGTAGLTTEWVFRTTTGDFGFRLAGGWVLGASYHPYAIYDSLAGEPLRYENYGTFAAHYTTGKYTVYWQAETASKAHSYQLGFIYRFGNARLPAKKRSYRERHPLPRHPPLPFGLGGHRSSGQ